MGRAKRADKKARREARRTEEAAAFEAADQAKLRARQTRRAIVIGIPVLTLLTAGVLYFVFDEATLAGAALLIGAVIFFGVGLATLGASVQPRQRRGAGSINFGNRR
jgi:hypothetical protein